MENDFQKYGFVIVRGALEKQTAKYISMQFKMMEQAKYFMETGKKSDEFDKSYLHCTGIFTLKLPNTLKSKFNTGLNKVLETTEGWGIGLQNVLGSVQALIAGGLSPQNALQKDLVLLTGHLYLKKYRIHNIINKM